MSRPRSADPTGEVIGARSGGEAGSETCGAVERDGPRTSADPGPRADRELSPRDSSPEVHLDAAPRLRRDLIFGPHPEDPARILIFDLRSRATVEVSRREWTIARLLDGQRPLRALVARSKGLVGQRVDAPRALAVAARLARLGLLDPGTAEVPGRASAEPKATRGRRPARARLPRVGPQWRVVPRPWLLPLAIHPETRFACEGAGSCCESGFSIALSDEEVEGVRAAHAALTAHAPGSDPSRGARDPVCLVPTAPGAPWAYALSLEPRCVFLDDARRCRVHGQPAQPRPCRVFPYRFVTAAGRMHVSIAHRCVCGTLGRGPALSAQRAEVRRRLAASPFVHAAPERTRIDRGRTEDTAPVVCALAGARGSSDPFALIAEAARRLLDLAPGSRGEVEPSRRAAVGPARDGGGPGTAGERPRTWPAAACYARLARALPPQVAADPRLPLVAALSGSPHPRAVAIAADQRRAGLFDPGADPRAEVARFVRDQLFGLEPYRFGTLAEGLLALALASARILHELPAEAHPEARRRIMLWESALLAPSLAALLGPAGPLGGVSSTLEGVLAQLRRLRAWSWRLTDQN